MTAVLLKFVHVLGIGVWAGGLICLPFLYLQRARLAGFALYRLHNFTRFFYVKLVSPAAFVAIASGTALIFVQSTFTPWFSVKLAFVGVLVLVHVGSGLQILRLFEPGKFYRRGRFVAVSALTLGAVSAILAVVLGKPEFGQADPFQGLLVPGALRPLVGEFIPWLR